MLKSSGMVSIPIMLTASDVLGMISLTMFINTVRDSNMVTPNICILVFSQGGNRNVWQRLYHKS